MIWIGSFVAGELLWNVPEVSAAFWTSAVTALEIVSCEACGFQRHPVPCNAKRPSAVRTDKDESDQARFERRSSKHICAVMNISGESSALYLVTRGSVIR